MSFGDEVGIFYDLPDTVYHALKIPSNSSVRKYAKLPALYELEYLKDNRDEPMKEHFQMGRVFEILVLEPSRADQIMTFSAKTYNSKEAEAMRATWPDKVLIAEHHLKLVETWSRCMLSKYPRNEANKVQVSCIVEFDWGHAKTKVKARMDEVDLENGIIYDYKLMEKIDSQSFEKDSWDHGYDTQAALYCRVMQKLFPRPAEEPWKFIFRVQQKHGFGFDERFTTHYWFDTPSLERAWTHVDLNLQLIAVDERYEGYHAGCLSTERFKWGR